MIDLLIDCLGSSPLVLVTGDRITKTLVNEEMREGEEGNRVKEEREKAVIAIQKNQDMLQVWCSRDSTHSITTIPLNLYLINNVEDIVVFLCVYFGLFLFNFPAVYTRKSLYVVKPQFRIIGFQTLNP